MFIMALALVMGLQRPRRGLKLNIIEIRPGVGGQVVWYYKSA